MNGQLSASQEGTAALVLVYPVLVGWLLGLVVLVMKVFGSVVVRAESALMSVMGTYAEEIAFCQGDSGAGENCGGRGC